MRFLIIVMFFLTMFGCSGIEEGFVTGKVHEPERTYIMFVLVYNGTTTTMVPYIMYDDEDFLLKLKDNNETGVVRVSRRTYEEVIIGKWYDFSSSTEVENNIKTRK